MAAPIIIGFGYKARHGKDTTVRNIIEEFGDRYDVRRYALADTLKREVVGKEEQFARQYGVTLDRNPDRTDPICVSRYGKQSKVLQAHGQARRQEDAFYWIHRLAEQIEVEQPQFALVADVRYLNEAIWVRSMGGIYVKVERPGYVDPTRDATHVSEVELDTVTPDYHISASNLNVLRHESLAFFSKVIAFLSGEMYEEVSTEKDWTTN